MGVDAKGKNIEIGEISQQRPKQYMINRKLSMKDDLPSSLSNVKWTNAESRKKPKLFKKKTAGAPSSLCNNTNLFVQIESRGKKKLGEQERSLEGILRTPQRRHHMAAKPPVPRSKAMKNKMLKTQIVLN